jgi:hypothetical protein
MFWKSDSFWKGSSARAAGKKLAGSDGGRVRLEEEVANRGTYAHPDMYHGNPALYLVVTAAMKQVGDPDGRERGCAFDTCKKWPVIHDAVGQKTLVNSLAPEVLGGSIVERAGRAYAGKQPGVAPVPKGVAWSRRASASLSGRRRGGAGRRRGRLLLCGQR